MAGNQAMSATSVQFTVATHIMAALAFHRGQEVPSAILAASVNANASFVRKSLSKLSKAGLIVTKRGKGGASALARPLTRITLLDIYRASQAPPAFAIHAYPVEKMCPVSCNFKDCMSSALARAQGSFEKTLAKITLAQMVAELHQKRR
jgi:Rrf2 family protein